MADQPITIPLSVHQQARFAQMRAESQRLSDRQNEAVTTIIALDHDPAAMTQWQIDLRDTEIVCTPPLPAPPTELTTT